MSNKQLETFFAKAQENKKIERQILNCGSDNTCVVAVGLSHGHKFSAANVGRWHRDHGGSLI